MKSKLILVLIILIAILTRLPFLEQFPNGFTGDEAQQGYSAYSILKTGSDEWGQFLPINPRGFGDFKPPLQTYLMTPSVAIFGLTIEAVRLPAAILGILTVLIVYFLANELLGDKEIGLWSSFLLSINPWHIQLSRTAFEGGIGVFTFSLGLLFFVRGLKNYKYLFPSVIFLGLTFYSYHSFRVFLVLFLIGILIIFRKLLTDKKILPVALVLIILVLPLVFSAKQILSRSSDVGIFSSQVIDGYFKDKTGSRLGLADKIFDNKFLFVTNSFVSNYLSYYSPYFFFTGSRPDNSYLNFPFFPLQYQFEIILWIIAGWAIFSGRVKNKGIILLWFGLAAIPASLATGSMNANRAVTFVPLTAIISGIGAKLLADKLKQKQVYILIPIMISFLFFLHFYFFELPSKKLDNLRVGYQETFNKILSIEKQFSEVVISRSFTEPQIFLAFYGKFDPNEFQKASQDWLRYERADKNYVDQLESWNLGKYKFESVNWKIKDSKRSDALIIAEPDDFPGDTNSIYDVKDSRVKILYRFVKVNNLML